MPNPSELERLDQEKAALKRATEFEIVMQFGPHQAKFVVPSGDTTVETAPALAANIATGMVPHIEEMLKAEERTHGR